MTSSLMIRLQSSMEMACRSEEKEAVAEVVLPLEACTQAADISDRYGGGDRKATLFSF